jgi:hypothetical protein
MAVALGAVRGEPPADSACEQRRAGNPQGVACWAVPSDTGHYVGNYVGGGCAVRCVADPPHADEGTWGWDYRGWLWPRRVLLGWWHGRSQGGTGAYRTDGPNLLHGLEEHGSGH